MYIKVEEKGSLRGVLKRHNFKKDLKPLHADGCISVNDFRVKRLDQTLSRGDRIQILQKKKIAEGVYILYEDKDILVVEKPENLLSVATDSKTEFKPSLHNLLKKRRRKIWPCHRIDYSVSGVMLFATNQKSKEHLFQQFKNHAILRQYYALVQGHLEKYSGTWDQALYEDTSSQVVVSPNGQRAVTHFKVLKKTKFNSYLQIELTTGKKHQIRVHTSHAGHPILGDIRYGSQQNPLMRLCLHAKKIGFIHPTLKKTMTFLSPPPF